MSFAIGTPVILPEYSVPADWPRTGVIEDVTDQTVIVELDNGRRQELPDDEVTPA